MFSELGVARFKAFPKYERLPIRPITLIYGPNSSGKTSILKSLLLMKQTVEQSESPEILLQPKGTLVDLGGYREFVFRHDVSQPLIFKIMVSGEDIPDRLPWLRPGFVFNKGTPIGLGISFRYDEKLETATINGVDLYIGSSEKPVATWELDLDAPVKRLSRAYFEGDPSGLTRPARTFLKFVRADYSHPFWQSVWSARRKMYDTEEILNHLKRRRANAERQLERLEKTIASNANESEKRRKEYQRIIKNTQKQIERMQDYSFDAAKKDFEESHRHSYLVCRNFLPSQVRIEESKVVEPDIEFMFDLGPAEGAVAAFMSVTIAEHLRKILEDLTYLGPLRESPERHYIFSGNLLEDVGKTGRNVPDLLFKNRGILERVNERLARFKFGYKLSVSSIENSRPELHDVFALRLVDDLIDVNASIVDVGFGISQVLPVIVQSMLSHRKTLCIEQPEIHLHPKMQGELANLFAESIREPFRNTFIVETHSEHVMLRIQHLIRTKQLDLNDVSVIYVDRGAEGSHCTVLRLDKNGDFIDRWPDGFFEESYREVFS